MQAKPKSFGKSTSYITHIDWSLDSQSIRTNDGSYEVLYYNVSAGKQDPNGVNSFRDETWATGTCTFTWGSIGIWQSGQDGSDINHCDRSHGVVSDGVQLIASGDDSSKVKVYRYPNPEENASAIQCIGHSSHVTKVRWAQDDSYLFSLGGNDTTTMQWKVTKKQ